ncbi:MAG: pyrimidine 5'-nucleotidase [candidate division WS1 bacterium]|jgi:putative hydrolase of the HAD superfamily|nr:pyrimidine 5'-nucleotidase [candidate division WS1 bacterium]
MSEPRDLDVILLDLDNTLYHPDCGLLEAGDRMIADFIARRLDLAWEEADRLRVRTWRQYGATARGLEIEFGIPQREFFAGSIERVPIERYISPQPELAAMLARLPQRLYVFTNAPAAYACRTLKALGIAEQIDGVFDIETTGGRPKPECHCYDHVVEEIGAPPERVALVEDTEENLAPAVALGMLTIKLGPPRPEPPHLYLERLEDLPQLLGLGD